MSNSNIRKPGLDFIRDSSDKLAAESIRKLISTVGDALVEFGCSPPAEESSDWFHQEGKAILLQLISEDPSSGWPFWIWDQSTNKVLQQTQESIMGGDTGSDITEFCPADFSAIDISITLGEAPSARNFTAYGSFGSSLGGDHVQLLKVEAEDGGSLPDFSELEISQIRDALIAKSKE